VTEIEIAIRSLPPPSDILFKLPRLGWLPASGSDSEIEVRGASVVEVVSRGDDRERSIFAGGNNFPVKLPPRLVPSDSTLWALSELEVGNSFGEAGKQERGVDIAETAAVLEAPSSVEPEKESEGNSRPTEAFVTMPLSLYMSASHTTQLPHRKYKHKPLA